MGSKPYKQITHALLSPLLFDLLRSHKIIVCLLKSFCIYYVESQ